LRQEPTEVFFEKKNIVNLFKTRDGKENNLRRRRARRGNRSVAASAASGRSYFSPLAYFTPVCSKARFI